MGKITRTGISFDKRLLEYFDRRIKEKGYTNRSEAINDIIRDFIHREKTKAAFGIIKVVYDHRVGHYNKKITELQHEYHCFIVSSIRSYIDSHKCLELILVRGVPSRIGVLVKKIRGSEGVEEAEFINLNQI